jgi:hypothetical protein
MLDAREESTAHAGPTQGIAVEDRLQVIEIKNLVRRNTIEGERGLEVLRRDERRREGSAHSQTSVSMAAKVGQRLAFLEAQHGNTNGFKEVSARDCEN